MGSLLVSWSLARLGGEWSLVRVQLDSWTISKQVIDWHFIKNQYFLMMPSAIIIKLHVLLLFTVNA